MHRSTSVRVVGVVAMLAGAMAALPVRDAPAQTPAPADDQAVFWDAPSYAGASLTHPFTTAVADLAASGWNDRVRSVAVGRYARVLAYENANFGGRCITFSGTSVGGATGRYPDMAAQNAGLNGPETWAARISSLRVVDGRTGATCATPNGTTATTTVATTTTTTTMAGSVGADQVQVFDLASFGGAVQAWTGPTAIPTLSAVRRTPSGTWSRRISSIRVGASLRVLAFDSANYKGKCITFAGSAAGGATGGMYADLAAQNAGLTGRSTWNNRIVSLRIVTGASGISCADLTGIRPGDSEAVVFEPVNFGEPVQRWTVPAEVPNLYNVVRPPRSRWDNVISSVKVGANVRIIAYENRNYLGRCITLSGSAVGGATRGEYPNLRAQNAGLAGSAHWDNRISSLKVVDGRTGASCTSAGGATTTTRPTGATSTTAGATTTTSGPSGSGSGGKQTAAVSMGDSFISGEGGRWQGNADPAGSTDRGTNRYEPARTTTAATSSGTTTINTAAGCHRSDVAEIHTADLPVDVRVNLACSGATTADFANEQPKPNEAQVGSRLVTPQLTQLDKVARDYDVKLIVVSIGGNDLGFADVIAACGKIYVLRTREMAEYFGSTCNAEQRAVVESKLGLAMTRVGTVISDIRAIMQRNGYAPTSYRIILQSYPSPIPRARDFGVPEGVPQIDRVAGFFTGAVAGTAAFPCGIL